jgi:hypothetical protein
VAEKGWEKARLQLKIKQQLNAMGNSRVMSFRICYLSHTSIQIAYLNKTYVKKPLLKKIPVV